MQTHPTTTNLTPTHVIFDCDGVLVDSETLSAGVLTRMMAEYGFTVTDAIFRDDFLGRSFANAVARAEQRFGRKLPNDIQLNYRDRLLAEMRRNLKAMPGVADVLAALSVPSWLATSSSPQRLAVSLSVSGLALFFKGRTSTASEVAHGKPAPDLFMLAAEKLGVSPSACLVIEDSLMGIAAAQNAGMAVWRFMGGSHMRAEDVRETPSGIRHVSDMAELHSALHEVGLCRAPQPR